jgi:hypothetical protein
MSSPVLDSPLLDDAFVAAQIDRALAPFVDKLDGDQLAWMREQLARTLVEDDAARAVLVGAHPRNIENSGEQVRLSELLRRAERLLDEERRAGGD